MDFTDFKTCEYKSQRTEDQVFILTCLYSSFISL